jgi:hypothetical protein
MGMQWLAALAIVLAATAFLCVDAAVYGVDDRQAFAQLNSTEQEWARASALLFFASDTRDGKIAVTEVSTQSSQVWSKRNPTQPLEESVACYSRLLFHPFLKI